jgi:hypothetical protein
MAATKTIPSMADQVTMTSTVGLEMMCSEVIPVRIQSEVVAEMTHSSVDHQVVISAMANLALILQRRHVKAQFLHPDKERAR